MTQLEVNKGLSGRVSVKPNDQRSEIGQRSLACITLEYSFAVNHLIVVSLVIEMSIIVL